LLLGNILYANTSKLKGDPDEVDPNAFPFGIPPPEGLVPSLRDLTHVLLASRLSPRLDGVNVEDPRLIAINSFVSEFLDEAFAGLRDRDRILNGPRFFSNESEFWRRMTQENLRRSMNQENLRRKITELGIPTEGLIPISI
jgi:hypothetical protein